MRASIESRRLTQSQQPDSEQCARPGPGPLHRHAGLHQEDCEERRVRTVLENVDMDMKLTML
jgi:hypothetical protein